MNISQDTIRHIYWIMQDFFRGYPDGFNALERQVPFPPFVAFRPISHIVCHPVDFDSQLRRRTIEIQGVGANWMLAAEFYAERFLAQLLPQHDLGFAHGLAKLSCLQDGLSGYSCHGPSVIRLRQGFGERHLPIASQQGGKMYHKILCRGTVRPKLSNPTFPPCAIGMGRWPAQQVGGA